MRKGLLFSVLFAGLAAFVAAGIANAAGMEKKEQITVKLGAFGSAKTQAKGDARFELSKGGDGLYYEIDVKGLKDVRMAHIHEYKDGKPGGIIAWLYPSPAPKPYEWSGSFSGTLSAGVLTGEQFQGPAAGKTARDVYGMLERGEAVVAVHTKANPDGELAGLVQPSKGHSRAERAKIVHTTGTPAKKENPGGY